MKAAESNNQMAIPQRMHGEAQISYTHNQDGIRVCIC